MTALIMLPIMVLCTFVHGVGGKAWWAAASAFIAGAWFSDFLKVLAGGAS